MSDPALLDELASLTDSPDAALERLEAHYREQKDFHKVFDTLLMQARVKLGLPLVRPTSFDDVPKDKNDAFTDAYVDAARTVGRLFLEDGRLADAWTYFGTIQEPAPVREALEEIKSPRELTDEVDELINLALYEGAHPVKGLEMMLRTHGTCNTVTATDQVMQQLSPEDRDAVARLLVRELHKDVLQSVQADVQQRMPFVPPTDSLSELLSGREWLFQEGNYHVDVSHLNASVRFARSLDPEAKELDLALELADYGSKLDPQLQYPGEPPFEEFYVAHTHFLQALKSGTDEETATAAIDYFKAKLDAEPDESDRILIAAIIIDLCMKTGRVDEGLALASQYAAPLQQYTGISFGQLCQQVGRLDALEQHAKESGDPLGFLAAKLGSGN